MYLEPLISVIQPLGHGLEPMGYVDPTEGAIDLVGSATKPMGGTPQSTCRSLGKVVGSMVVGSLNKVTRSVVVGSRSKVVGTANGSMTIICVVKATRGLGKILKRAHEFVEKSYTWARLVLEKRSLKYTCHVFFVE